MARQRGGEKLQIDLGQISIFAATIFAGEPGGTTNTVKSATKECHKKISNRPLWKSHESSPLKPNYPPSFPTKTITMSH